MTSCQSSAKYRGSYETAAGSPNRLQARHDQTIHKNCRRVGIVELFDQTDRLRSRLSRPCREHLSATNHRHPTNPSLARKTPAGRTLGILHKRVNRWEERHVGKRWE